MQCQKTPHNLLELKKKGLTEYLPKFNKTSHFISNLLNVFLTTLSRFSFSHLTCGMGSEAVLVRK